MILRFLLIAVGIVPLLTTTICLADEALRTFVLDGAVLAAARVRLQQHPTEYQQAVQSLRDAADKAMDQGPWSVMDKRLEPPSGDKHDYYSVGPYWWPDPKKPDGLPYIRRDGKVNPERDDFDSDGLYKTIDGTNALARAWYFTGESKYAERAALLLKTWFLDPQTKMNPNLQYGQAIPGICDGRGIGIIDTASLIGLVDSVGLLGNSPAWSESDQRALQSWFREYLRWLRESKNGRDEDHTKNNHAVWYDAQVASFALFVDDLPTARRVLEKVGPRRIATQIEPDGSMPHELARTKSFSYTSMNLRGFLTLARLAEHVNVDLWHYQSADGRGIEAALDWLAPFALKEKEWQWQQIKSLNPASAAKLYRSARHHFDIADKPAYHQLGSQPSDPVTELLSASQQDQSPEVSVVIGGPLDEPSAEPSRLDAPFGAGFDAKGNMYVVELAGGRVHRYAPDGTLTTIAGQHQRQGYEGNGGLAGTAVFNGMHNIAVTPAGDLFIADSWNHCIRKIDGKTGGISTIAGTGEPGFSGDGGPARQAQFDYLMCITLNATHDKIYCADLRNRRIRMIDLQTGLIETVAGNGEKGVPEQGSRAVDSPLVDPRAVTVDSQQNVYILERGGHALRMVSPDGIIRTVAGTGKKGDVVGPAMQSEMGSPKHLAVDQHDNVIIADDLNARILVYSPTAEHISVLLGAGVDQPQVTLSHPHGVAVHSDGSVYIVDTGHHRILRVATKP